MRSLSSDALTKIHTRLGNEPVIIIDVEWGTGNVQQYSDKPVESISGKILQVSNLDSVVSISSGKESQEITVTLSDTDGTIKSIMDSYDIHKKNVSVYQYFEGLDLEDRFLLFKGKINSPIVWKDGDRTVTFSIVSQLEDKEIGFSPEEGQFPFIPKDLIGKAWPMIFGTPLDVPAVRITDAVSGHLMCGVGIISGSSQYQSVAQQQAAQDHGCPPDISEQAARLDHVTACALAFENAASDNYLGNPAIASDYSQQADNLRREANEIRESMTKTLSQWSNSVECAKCKNESMSTLAVDSINNVSCNPVTILGGEDFPRGNIILVTSGGGYFEGYFEGDTNIFTITRKWHDNNETSVSNSIAAASSRQQSCPACEADSQEGKTWFFRTAVPSPYGNSGTYNDYIVTEGFSVNTCRQGAGGSQASQAENYTGQSLREFWADAGTTVRLYPGESFTHIVSIIPGEVLAVKAFKSLYGEDKLVDVPSDYYTVQTTTYGSITAVEIVCQQLSLQEGQEWSGEQLYVTFESSIGPNIVDILEYLIQTYSDLDIDAASFNYVKTKLEVFPANFALLDRENLISVLEDIAFQARCSLRLVNGTFYLRYLPEEPTSIATLTENDIIYNDTNGSSIEVSLTPTEDLVTKYIATWKLSYAQDEDDKIILRHNVEKYGLQEETYNFYIYNQPDIIYKVATFWLIRKSNSWKYISFETFLNHLDLETSDAITFNFSNTYISTGSIKGEIEVADFDSESQTIFIRCWLPIKAGQMTQYVFAWPADISEEITFPLEEEIEAGYAGGNGIGANASGELPIGDTTRIESKAVFVGGPNVVYGSRSDWGDSTPTDTGFTAQSLGTTSSYGIFTVIPKPVVDLSINFVSPAQIYAENAGGSDFNAIEIILEKTPIKSISVPGQVNTLAEILESKEGESLSIKNTTLFSGSDSGACIRKPFAFRYHEESDLWVSGASYLVDTTAPPPEECEDV
jgi:hypothetical protein